jgi:GWxTD domain-containing protein
MKKLIFLSAICLLFISAPFLSANSQDKAIKNQIKKEEIDKYIKEWLDSPIRYIITKKEEKAFKKLKKREEKIRFINYFWLRRDPNPKTAKNEFKDEFINRVALSNHYFGAMKKEGWKTDRGRFLILFGPPHEKYTGVGQPNSNPDTAMPTEIELRAYRYEVWTYHNLPVSSIPPNYFITFIDWYGNRDYIFDSASYHGKADFEKAMDKRFYMPRSGFIPKELAAAIEDIKSLNITNKDLKFKDVPVFLDIHNELPFRFFRTAFRLDKSLVQLLIGLSFTYQDVMFRKDEENNLCTSIIIDASLLDKEKNKVDSFEQHLSFAAKPEVLEKSSYENFIYWHCLKAKPGKYLLSIKAEDIISHASSEWKKEIEVPSFPAGELMFSEIILADAIVPAPEIQDNAVFIDTINMLGHQITPNMNAMFCEGSQVCLFFQVMNLQLNSESSKPLTTIKCYIYKDNKVFRIINPPDSSFAFREPNEILASFCIPLQDFPLGEYTLSLIAVDKIADKEISRKINFEVIENK